MYLKGVGGKTCRVALFTDHTMLFFMIFLNKGLLVYIIFVSPFGGPHYLSYLVHIVIYTWKQKKTQN